MRCADYETVSLFRASDNTDEIERLRADNAALRGALVKAREWFGEYVGAESDGLWFCSLCDADGYAQTEAETKHTPDCIIGAIDAALGGGNG